MSWKQKLGESMRKARNRKHLTRGELREALRTTGFEISINSLGLYERGERSPDIDTLLKIAEVLGSEYFDVDDNLQVEFRKNGGRRPLMTPQQLKLDFDENGGVNIRIEQATDGLVLKKNSA
jgi:transcriptional regulator with XRE-family HTH domain